ncbi:unnamed protein product [Trichobilharzia regenti]|nr:unnamed protein product [Trichobilharzia regenti]
MTGDYTDSVSIFSHTSKRYHGPTAIRDNALEFEMMASGIYTSVVGPFGGFFASGFKRAFKIKDFGDLFPGHGGVVDRFDCQVLIGTFVLFYYNSFVR